MVIMILKLSLSFLLLILSNFGILAQGSLVSPSDGLVQTSNLIQFEWNEKINGSPYRLVVDNATTNDNFLDLMITGTDTTLTLAAGHYSWRVLPTGDAFSSLRTFRIVSPQSLEGTVFWITADNVLLDGNNRVETWLDLTGNNRHFTQSISARRGLLLASSTVFNAEPVVDFVATQQHFYNGPNLSFLSAGEVFAVFRLKTYPAPTSPTSGIWTFGTGTLNDHFPFTDGVIYSGFGRSTRFTVGNPSSTFILTNPFVLNITTASQFRFRINGTTTFTNSAGVTGFTSTPLFGKSLQNHQLNAFFAEMILFDSELSIEQRSVVNDYLYHKYAPPVNLGADVTIPYGFCPVLLSAEKPFYTNYLWSSGQTSSNIQVSQSGNYWVEVTNNFGRVSRDTVRVTYPGIFQFSDSIICGGSEIIIGPGLDGNYTYLWSNGESTPQISINTSGQYSVTVTDNSSCSRTSNTFQITVDDFPNSLNLGGSASLCSGNSIDGTIPGVSDIFYLWNTGFLGPVLTISESGTYWLQATNVNSCIATDTIEVLVIGVSPNVLFDAPNNCLGTPSSFTNISVIPDGSTITDLTWIIDGVSFQDEIVSVIFESAGEKSFSLYLELDNGCNNLAFGTTTVFPTPTLSISSAEEACIEVPFIANITASIPSPDSILLIVWIVNSEAVGDTPELSYIFQDTGNFVLTASAISQFGCQSSTSSNVMVLSSAEPSDSFTLVNPYNAYSTTEQTIVFEWNESPGAISYTLELSNDLGFTEPTTFEVFGTNLSIDWSSNGLFYWRVSAFNLCNIPRLSNTRSFTKFSISELNEVQFWINASSYTPSISGRVLNLIDLKSQLPVFSQLTASQQPFPLASWTNLNEMPVLDFISTQQHSLNGPDLSSLNEGEILSIVQLKTYPPSTSVAGGIWTFGTSSQHDFFPFTDGNIYSGFGRDTRFTIPNPSNNFNMTAPLLLNFRSGSSFSFYIGINEVFSNTGGAVAFPSNSLLGRSLGNHHLNGYFAEAIMFNRTLTSSERSFYQNYLFNKYAPPVNLGQDIVIPYGFCTITLDAGERFASYQWSTGETTQTIDVISTGTYSVTVVDIFGRTSTDEIKVTFPGKFLTSDFFVCIGDTFVYETQLPADGYSFLWNTEEETPSIAISEGGQFSVTVSDTIGCTFTSPIVTATIDYFPETLALEQLPTFCLGNTLFLSSGAEEAETYLWSTGSTDPIITPAVDGTYWVEATNANGCVGRDTVEVVIAGVAPTAAYTVSPPCAATELTFADATVPEGSTITAWQWDFGVSTATTPTATATFPTVGQYPIALTVTLSNGCTGTLRDTIAVNYLPLVNFTAPVVCAGSEVIYESVSAVPGGVPITAWAWTFGNGTTDTGVLGSTVFAGTGPNTVTLTVVSAQGCSATLSRNIEVLGSPVPDFDFTTVCISQPTLFTENVDVSQSGPVFYNWQFGNGFFSNFPNTSHLYSNPGVYEVTLTTTGNNGGLTGCAASITRQVAVYPAPIAQAGFEGACLGEAALFTDLTNPVALGGVPDAIATRLWTVGGFPSGNAAVQPYPADAVGTFTAAMQITTGAGCTATTSGSFSVLPTPVAAFELELPIAAPPFALTPINLSVNAEESRWTVNGTYIGEGSSPELFFAEVGNYVVQLVASSGEGCADTLVKGFFVVEPMFDLEIREVTTIETDNKLRIFTVLSNRGNVPINGFDMDVQVGLSPNVFAKSDLTIPLGATMPYTLPLIFDRTSDFTMPYVCVEVSNPGGILDPGGSFTETDLSNNRLCAGLPISAPVYVPPYPNPAGTDVNFGIILTTAGPLLLEIYDAQGKQVRSFSKQMNAGYTLHTIPVHDFMEGMYMVRYAFGGDTQTVRFVVAR